MKKHTSSFDFILDTVSAEHNINAYIQLLRRDGNITLVGAPDKPHAVSGFGLLFQRRSISGSIIGGLTETQEMLDFVLGITSLQMLKLFLSRRLTRLTIDCSSPM